MEVKHNYGFLFKKSVLQKSELDHLLQLDEFVSAIDKVMDNGTGIEDSDIYAIVRDIYFPMLKDFETDGFKESYKKQYGSQAYKEWSFKYRTFGGATRRFSKALYGYEKWREEYEEYIR